MTKPIPQKPILFSNYPLFYFKLKSRSFPNILFCLKLFTKGLINKIGKIESNLIFGIDDVQIKDEIMKELLKDFIKKNRRDKNEEEWKKLIETNNFSKIYFYGHSFADADYTFFEDLFDLINLENNKAVKLIFLYSSGFSCERSVNSLIKKYALKKHKGITKLKNKLEIKEIN